MELPQARGFANAVGGDDGIRWTEKIGNMVGADDSIRGAQMKRLPCHWHGVGLQEGPWSQHANSTRKPFVQHPGRLVAELTAMLFPLEGRRRPLKPTQERL